MTTYSYDVNGNRVKQVSDDEELTYGYDVYNRLMAVRDKQGLLMAALYDGVGGAHTNSVTGKKIGVPHVHDKNVPGDIREPYEWEFLPINKNGN